MRAQVIRQGLCDPFVIYLVIRMGVLYSVTANEAM
jgi:hypothetical protein